jgi:alpha-glucosidase
MNDLIKKCGAGIVWLSLASTALAAPAAVAAVADSPPPATEPVKVQSPDGTIEATIQADGPLRYSVTVDGQPIISDARLGLKLREGTTLGADVELSNSASRGEDSTWENPLGKQREVRNQYRETTLLLRERSAKDRTFQLIFRVFDDGVAFRYVLVSQPGMRGFVLDQDLTEFRFPADATCYAGEHEKGMRSSQEWEFRKQRLAEIAPNAVKGLPVLVETPAAWVAIAEADLLDWSGMWIAGKPHEEASGTASASPADGNSSGIEPSTEGSTAVTLVAKLAPRLDGEGLVKADTPHHSSWRVLMIGRQPGRLIESEIIRNLSTPSKLADSSWVKPGMMAWDHWWTGDTIMDTATIKSYIQLAADMGWEYQLIDWQWYGTPEQEAADITRVIPALDMEEVRRFAAERGVRLWLWLHWTDVDRNDAYKKAFPLYEKWGIAGVKIDFMDRDDQEMVDWYEKITAAAAEHKLMVNFHGAFKTCGFDRTYPNQVTREGILGNEYNKWSERVTPEHKLTLPFTRYLEGPSDFTPGGFLNRQPGQFKTNVKPTQVQGTRAGELALFVCYDSPVCCVCDHPDNLRDQPGADFLKVVPTVWDETRVLDGAVGEHLVMARRSGDDWYLGAMTNRQPREIPVKLDFLDRGRWNLKLWHDADDSGENAEHLAVDEKNVSAGDTITLELAPAGGCVGLLQRE